MDSLRVCIWQVGNLDLLGKKGQSSGLPVNQAPTAFTTAGRRVYVPVCSPKQ